MSRYTVCDEEHDHYEQLNEVERDDIDSGDDGNQRQQGLDRTVECYRGDDGAGDERHKVPQLFSATTG